MTYSVPPNRREMDEDGEYFVLFAEPKKQRRWRRKPRKRNPGTWSNQDVCDHVVTCYYAGHRFSAVVTMPEEETDDQFVQERRETSDGIYKGVEWWGINTEREFGALVDGAAAMCEAWGCAATEDEACQEAREWVGEGLREITLLDVARLPLLATLEAVHLGAFRLFQER